MEVLQRSHEKMGDPGSERGRTWTPRSHGGADPGFPEATIPNCIFTFSELPTPRRLFLLRPATGRQPLFTSCIVALECGYGEDGLGFPAVTARHARLGRGANSGDRRRRIQGQTAQAVLDASRNGYFFVLDRVTGEHLLTVPYADSLNWSKGIDKAGRPVRDPEKDASPGGALVSPDSDGIVNWQPPTYDPQTGLFYVSTDEIYSVYYRTEPNVRALQGLNGIQEQRVGSIGKYITAIDYKTGKIAWKHLQVSAGEGSGNSGLTTTAGKLLFGGDANGNLVAYDPANGKPLWHTHLGLVSNAVETYMLDGRQYILAASGDSLYAFALNF